MAHWEQRDFVQKIKNELPEYFTNQKVLEVGSLNINGTLRDFFSDCNYIGIDVCFGDGVDVICEGQKYNAPDNTYNVVCSAECFEHNPFWLETFQNMIRLCKDGGLLFFTCATDGRSEHGTTRTTPSDSPLTVSIGWDYYKNLKEKDFTSKLNFDFYFSEYKFEINQQSHDLYFYGIVRKHINYIPVIGVPIVNGVHWLKRLILSVDYPVKNFFIINNNGRGEITEELNELCSMNHPFIENLHVSHMPSNLGVSGSWNLIIKSYMLEPYWILSNNDVMFSPGMLERMHLEAETNHDVGMIHGKKSPEYDSGMYDLFLIKDCVIQKCGLFDENYYPAYCEDLDYYISCKNNNVNYKVLNIDYLHGEKDYSTSGSQTWRLDLQLKEKLNKSTTLNIQYLHEKWGNDCLASNEYIEPKKMKYDLNFLREKHMGF
jgi:SAM-dependent methyltransferase